MERGEVESYELSVKPLTRYFDATGEFPIWVKLTRGGKIHDIFEKKLRINAKDGVAERLLRDSNKDYFRLKARKRAAGGFQVSFTALQDVQDGWGYDTKVRLFCGAWCRHSYTVSGGQRSNSRNSIYISDLELERGVWEKKGYVYTFKVKNTMKRGNSFTLHFDKVSSDRGPYRTTYQPYVQYWPKDNKNSSVIEDLGKMTFR